MKWVRVPGTMPKRRVATRQRPMARTRAKGSPDAADAPDIAAPELAVPDIAAPEMTAPELAASKLVAVAVSAFADVSAAELAGKPPGPAIKVSSPEPAAEIPEASKLTSSSSSLGTQGFSNHMRATIFP